LSHKSESLKLPFAVIIPLGPGIWVPGRCSEALP
jgi:hypothetical protein